MTARTDAQARLERSPATVLEIDLDRCDNAYGVSPCTAGRKDTGTAQAGGASTITLRAGASAVNDFYKNMTVRTTGGTGPGQERRITAYVGATKVATADPAWSVNPDGTTTYDVIDRPNGCYNTHSTCQDKPNYVKGVKTVKFCERGMPLPPGELVRPYMTGSTFQPTQINMAKGLANRSQAQVVLTDEPAMDVLDPYLGERLVPAGATFWPRLIARNPNAVGRLARVRNGYAVSPWDWATFQTELYVIDAIRGPDGNGQVTVVLSDAIKLLDRAKVPAVTDGKLVADLPAASFSGAVMAASATTVTFANGASPLDSAYNGQEVFITANTGAGQRRVISAYDGTSRTATVPAWSVNPDANSFCEVTPLAFALTSAKGPQYPDPAVSGKNEYVRVGDEVIRYAGRTGDTLAWPDGTYRAQFATARDDHKTKDSVQLCRVWIGKPAKEVVENIINEGGLADTYIDLAGLAVEDGDWLGESARITTCIADPETASALLADLLLDLNMMCWWHPVEQKAKFKCDMPQLGSVVALTDDKLMRRSTAPERLDAERITRAFIDYNLVNATADRRKRANFRTIVGYVDPEAEGANGYNDVRPDLRESRWLTSLANDALATANVARKVSRLRDAPSSIKFKLDPKDEVALGALVDLTTRRLVDESGNAKLTRCRVIKLIDQGGWFEGELRTTNFLRRYGFIGPAGGPDYGAATVAQRTRAFIAQAGTGLMSDGSSAYLIS